ncbi:MAG: oligosaccharide flippase family protein, partial [Thermoleophilia bacterium]|nr:oligosaccharide flippase family protein [Thermoleophilia bacterium]
MSFSAIKRLFTKFISESIYANTSYLLSSWILLSGFGFIFWTICTKIYSAEQVGIATALLAALNLITSLSLMGFELSIIRVLPDHPDKSTLLNVCFSTASLFGIVFSFIFVLLVPFFGGNLGVVNSSVLNQVLFFLFVVIALGDYLTTNTFVAYRKSGYVLRKNLIFSIFKLVFPFLFISLGSYGVFSAWMISLGLALIYGMIVLTRQFRHNFKPQLGIAPLRGMIKYSFGNYFSSFAEGFPIMVLPILIVNVYSPEEGAYYYIAMMIATFLFTISASATQSLFAEASSSDVRMVDLVRKVLKFLVLLLIPAIVAIMLLGPYILSIFGPEYSREAADLLRILALS